MLVGSLQAQVLRRKLVSGYVELGAQSLLKMCINDSFAFTATPGHGESITVRVLNAGNRGATCGRPPPSGPPLGSCQSLRNKIPYSDDEQAFGPTAADPEVKTPFSLYAGISQLLTFGI